MLDVVKIGHVNLKYGSTIKLGAVSVFAVLISLAVLASMSGCATVDRRPAPSLSEIVRMSAEGVADEQIIAQLAESRAVYPLTSSQIVDLHEQGVTMAVLDYMQQVYVESVRREERMMYSDPFWGYPCIGCTYYRGRGTPYWIYPYWSYPY